MAEPTTRPAGVSYVPDFRDMNTERSTRFVGGPEPSHATTAEVALLINFAIRVGQGTETRKSLAELAERVGVRRLS